MSAANYGILSSFDHNTQSWKTYRSRLRQYFIANDIDDAKDTTGTKRKAILLSALSEGTFKLAADLALPKQIDDVPFEDIVSLLDGHFTPTRVGFGERHNFYSSSQQPGESPTQWAARLRGLTAHCGFSNLEEILRDRFVMGLLPGQEKEKLYAHDPKDLTLTKAVQLAESIRCARAGAAASNTETGGQNATQLYKISRSSKKSGGPTPPKDQCTVCGYNNHKSSECRYANYVCKRCKVKGHLRRMCTKVKYVNLEDGSPRMCSPLTLLFPPQRLPAQSTTPLTTVGAERAASTASTSVVTRPPNSDEEDEFHDAIAAGPDLTKPSVASSVPVVSKPKLRERKLVNYKKYY